MASEESTSYGLWGGLMQSGAGVVTLWPLVCTRRNIARFQIHLIEAIVVTAIFATAKRVVGISSHSLMNSSASTFQPRTSPRSP